MSNNNNSNFISIPEAISKFDSCIFIDGSWHLSKDRDARTEYENGPRIKDAHFFDIDDIATIDDVNNPKNLPHMMPPTELFAKVMDIFSITPTSTIVVYGTRGCAATSRAFYTFKRLCQPSNQIYLMQGSLQEWIDAGGPIENGLKKSIHASDLKLDKAEYEAGTDNNSITMDQMLLEVSDDVTDSIIIDARGAGRFYGKEPEPRPGLRGGHMPGAYNVPFTDLLDNNDVTKFKSPEQMKEVFQNAGVDVATEKRVILSCGSGVTACVLAVGLFECGRDPSNTFIYDGSWIDWVSEL